MEENQVNEIHEDLRVARKLVNLCKSANSRSIPFKVSFKVLKQLMRRKTCYYTGVTFDSSNILTIDRVDNDQGYIDSNIVACTQEINHIKSSLTIDQIDNLHKKIFSHIEKKKV